MPQPKSHNLKATSYQLQATSGYIALIALLVVVAAGLTIGVAVSLQGIEEIQTSYGSSEASYAKSLATACLEEGLERLRTSWADYSVTLPVGSNSCILEIVTDGGIGTLNATSTIGLYTQHVGVQVQLVGAPGDTHLEVLAWEE